MSTIKIVGAWLTLLLWGAMAHAGTHHHYYTDPQGNVLAKTDAQGNIIATYDYAPYGSAVAGMSGSPNGPGYTGHVNDPESGLVYMQARYYDPVTAHFLSTDPVSPAAGNLFNFNRYTYANNNPIANIDPDGRESACVDESNHCNGPSPNSGAAVKVLGGSLQSGIALLNEATTPLMAMQPEIGGALEGLEALPALFGLADAGEAAGGTSLLAGSEVPTADELGTRVANVHSALDPIAQTRRTTAGLNTTQGTRVMASGGRDLSPAQRTALQSSEVAARSPGAHAEVTALDHAAANGLTPVQMSVSRPICSGCASAIQQSGGQLTSPTTAVWPN